jgi:hypothetical protein
VIIVAAGGEVPAGKALTIEAYMDGAQWPPELMGAFALGRVYEIGTLDLALNGPVTIRVMLSANLLLGGTASFANSVYLLMLANGEWRALNNLESQVSASHLILTAQADRPGVLTAVFGGSAAAAVDLLNSRRTANGG